MARGIIDASLQPFAPMGEPRAAEPTVDLARLRASRGSTQIEMAAALAISQGGVSRLERRQDLLLSTLREYVEALGGHLELRAVFPDGSVEIVSPPRHPAS
jgi:transcriptional regulator with XRE-family HTH domain